MTWEAESSAKHTIIEADTLHQLDAAPPLFSKTRHADRWGGKAVECHSVSSCGATRGHEFIRGRPLIRGVTEEEGHDLPSEQPVSETLMAKTSRLKSVANAVMIAAFSAPQEVKFASTVNSPVRLAASDESGKCSVSLKMFGNHKMLPPSQTWNEAPRSKLGSSSHKIQR